MVASELLLQRTPHYTPIAAVGNKHRSWKRCLEVILAAILILAASLKVYELTRTSQPAMVGLIHSKTVVIELVEAESLLALWLIVGGRAYARFVTALTLFAIFAVAAAYEALHRMPNCGCFGTIQTPPLIIMFIDILAVASLWATRPREKSPAENRPTTRRFVGAWILAMTITIALAILYVTRVSSGLTNADQPLVLLEPRSWIGARFPLFDELDGAGELPHGHWLVVLYHDDCETCQEAIPSYLDLANRTFARTGQPQVAFIKMPADNPTAAPLVPPSEAYLRLNLRPDHE